MQNPKQWKDIEGWSDVDAETRGYLEKPFKTPADLFAKFDGSADFEVDVLKNSTTWAQTAAVMLREYETLSFSLEEGSGKVFDYLNFEWAFKDDILFVTDITPKNTADNEVWRQSLKAVTEVGLDLGVANICVVVKEGDEANLIVHAAKAGYETDTAQMEEEDYCLEGILADNASDYEDDSVADAAEGIAADSVPQAIWNLADFNMEVDGETVTGYELLDGAVWFGILHLPDPSERDEDVRQRMKDYLGIEI